MSLMIEHGFMPTDKAERARLRSLDPYQLRRRGLDEPLAPYEFGRALFHLNQRRGFQSNRKIDRTDGDEDRGKIATSIGKTREQMNTGAARTIGEWLARRHEQREPVRARLNGQGARSQYELYVQRSMIAEEFDALWAAQSRFTPAVFTQHARDLLRDALLFQRRLRPVIPGKCLFEPVEYRAPLALPSVQRFRIYQDVNHLRILETGQAERPLEKQQRDRVAEVLLRSPKRSFDQLRKLLDLPEDATFNLESAKRKDLRGDATGAALARKAAFGPRWFALPLEKQDEIVQLLLDAEQEQTVTLALRERYDLSAEQATQVAQARLVQGYGSISRKAILAMLPRLESDVVTYDAAARAAGYEHTRRSAGGVLIRLPYYAECLPQYVGTGSGEIRDRPEKRFGRISNPTVHVALNQLREVVNAVIDKFGRPHQIVIEVVRDLKLSRERKRQIEQEQQRRQEDNERHREQLEQAGLPINGGNLLRLRLWEELAQSPTDRRCPYTGEMISFTRLFSEEVEIEHILPFSATLDDSASNKTVAMRKANRDKGNRSPFDAFGHSPTGYDWEQILNRASLMPFPPQRRRFAPDALAQYQVEGDFLARHLTDTAFVSRVAREYLTAVCPSNQVWSIPGRLTALLRKRWGLNSLLSDTDSKNRTDQRHHTIDAAVVAVTDRALLQRMSSLSARDTEVGMHRFLEGLNEPWPGYRRGLEFGLGKVIVSYKPDHGIGARLHNDTAYGLVEPARDGDGAADVVHRVPLLRLKGSKDAEQIRDPAIRGRVQEAISGKAGKDITAALEALSLQSGIRRVRMVEPLSVIRIRRADGTPYKAYKGDSNYCYQVFASTRTGRWFERVVSSFEAAAMHSPAIGDPMVMQLCVNDTLRLQGTGAFEGVYRVVSLTPGMVFLAPHHEGGNLRERDRDRTDAFKYLICSASRLQKLQAQQVVADPIGQVWPVKRANAGADRRDRGERAVPVMS